MTGGMIGTARTAVFAGVIFSHRLCLLLHFSDIESEWLRFIINLVVGTSGALVLIFLIGLKNKEKNLLLNKIFTKHGDNIN